MDSKKVDAGQDQLSGDEELASELLSVEEAPDSLSAEEQGTVTTVGADGDNVAGEEVIAATVGEDLDGSTAAAAAAAAGDAGAASEDAGGSAQDSNDETVAEASGAAQAGGAPS